MGFIPETIELSGSCFKDGSYVVFDPSNPVRKEMVYHPDTVAAGKWNVEYILVSIGGFDYGLPADLFSIVDVHDDGSCSKAVLELNLTKYNGLFPFFKSTVTTWCEQDLPAKLSIRWENSGESDEQYVKPPQLISPP